MGYRTGTFGRQTEAFGSHEGMRLQEVLDEGLGMAQTGEPNCSVSALAVSDEQSFVLGVFQNNLVSNFIN